MVELPAATCSSPASRPLSRLRNSPSMPSRPSTSGRASSYRAGAAPGQGQAPADALEQRLAQVPFQRLQLQGHGRLAEEQRLGRPRHRAQPGHLAEGPQRLEAVALVVEPRASRRPLVRSAQYYEIVNTYPFKYLFCQICSSTASALRSDHEPTPPHPRHRIARRSALPATPVRRARRALLTPGRARLPGRAASALRADPPGPADRPPRPRRPLRCRRAARLPRRHRAPSATATGASRRCRRALLDRRVEITGPVEPKMVINALNSGARVYMADFEDSTAPTWANLLARPADAAQGGRRHARLDGARRQQALRAAARTRAPC